MLKNVETKKAVNLLQTCLGAIASPPPGPIAERARIWSRDGVFVSLLEPGAGAFRELANLTEKKGLIDDRQKARDVLSRDYIEIKVEELIGDLVTEAAQGGWDASQLPEQELRSVWKRWLDDFEVPSEAARYYTLVAGLELEEAIEIGTVKLSPWNETVRHELYARLGLSEGGTADREAWEREWKDDIGRGFPIGWGIAIAEDSIAGAEPIRARALFRERVEEALHVLAFFRVFVWPVGARVVLSLSGNAPAGRNVIVSHTTDDRIGLSGERATLPFILTRDRWEHAKLIGLDFVSELLSKPRAAREKLEATCINAIEWVSRGLQDDVADSRFLKFCVGMESLLLKRSDQPLGGTMAERVAFLLGGTGAAREQIYFRVKDIYKVRSDIAHEGRSTRLEEDLGSAQFFAVYVVQAFLRRMRELTWETREDFEEWCDREKWHGGKPAEECNAPQDETQVSPTRAQ
jgi:hypothetical protein